MSNPQPPYGQQPPAPWSPYPGNTPAGGYPQQGGYAPPSNYPTPGGYPSQPPGMYAPPSGYGQQPGGYNPNPYMPMPPAPQGSSQNLTTSGALAAIGGIAALIGFFAVPFYTVSFSYLGASQSQSVKGTDFTKNSSTATSTSSVSYPYLWIVVVAAVIALCVGAYMAFGMKGALPSKARSAATSLIGLGAISVAILFYVFVNFNSKVHDAFANAGVSGSTAGLSYGFAAGFWICVIGMLAAIIGGGMAVSKSKS